MGGGASTEVVQDDELDVFQNIAQIVANNGVQLTFQGSGGSTKFAKFIAISNAIKIRRRAKFRVLITGTVQTLTPIVANATAAFAIYRANGSSPAVALPESIVQRQLTTGASVFDVAFDRTFSLEKDDMLTFEFNVQNGGTGNQASTLLPAFLNGTNTITGNSLTVRIFPIFTLSQIVKQLNLGNNGKKDNDSDDC
jgi:hypothetical protein